MPRPRRQLWAVKHWRPLGLLGSLLAAISSTTYRCSKVITYNSSRNSTRVVEIMICIVCGIMIELDRPEWQIGQYRKVVKV